MQINIFKNQDKKIDIEKLIDTRMLICANSGGGKSYAARRIMEEAGDKVMSIIIDVDGEFKTLREKYDFLLIGDTEEGADVQINMNAAHLLPKKIMELEVSTIIDISDYSWRDRISYVKKLLRALLELPRKLWKSCFVFLDESHKFCGQQEKQESTYEVIDLMSQGRKRGLCGMLMSQRISKLHKDAAAEANNVMIGRTILDIDQKRAADILGFSDKKMARELRNLDDGEFWVFGPAIDNEVEKEFVSLAKTTHPKRGQLLANNISKPTERIKSLLSKISDLPEEAKKELKDLNDYKSEIVRLKNEITNMKKNVNKPEIDIEVVNKKFEEGIKKGYDQCKFEMFDEIKSLKVENDTLVKRVEKIAEILNVPIPKRREYNYSPQVSKNKSSPLISNFASSDDLPKKVVSPNSQPSSEDINSLPLAEKKIYTLLYQYPDKIMSYKQIATFVGYSYKGGGFRNAIAKLNTLGLIERGNGTLKINPELLEI